MKDQKSVLAVNPDKVSSYLWAMFATCFLGNILAGTASTLMSVYLPVLVSDLLGQVDPEKMNRVSASINALYFVGWAVGGLTWGLIGDRIGRARSLAMAVGMFGLFTFAIAFAPSWEVLLILRFFCGFGVGGTLVLDTTLLSEVWPERSRAIFIGILSIGFPVGIFSSGLLNFFVSGWRQGFMMGILPMILSVILLFFLNESEKWKTARAVPGNRASRIPLGVYRKDLINGSIIFGSMLIGLWAVFSWIPTWVQSLLADHDSQRERSLSMMVLGAGGLSGGFFSGWVSNSLGTRKAMLVCFSACFILSFILFKGTVVFSGITLFEIALLAFTFGISQGLLGVYIPLLFPVALRASATGFCFNIGRFLTAATVFFVGALVTWLGGYGNSLFLFSFVFLVGFVFLFFSKKITN